MTILSLTKCSFHCPSPTHSTLYLLRKEASSESQPVPASKLQAQHHPPVRQYFLSIWSHGFDWSKFDGLVTKRQTAYPQLIPNIQWQTRDYVTTIQTPSQLRENWEAHSMPTTWTKIVNYLEELPYLLFFVVSDCVLERSVFHRGLCSMPTSQVDI